MSKNKVKIDPADSLNRRGTHRHPEQKQVADQLQKEELRRWTMDMPVSLHKELKLFAVTNDRNMRSVAISALKEYLRK